ncbi:DUF3530 family protein [Paraglaciecola aquimarina]|uniref:DUF3530 family protein n=1 Tax=Paraglaciecola aquimarina TaxID=1235557 RepID=A0ABU3SRT6_9ALTE|nr:DUF3530 family protein [Paraglaciecola aquimarina]MDU0352702.1 DUF3530 family protein [Paraglaciecola aquimarina]
MLRQLDIQRDLFPDEYKSVEIEGRQYFYVINEKTTPLTRGIAVLIADSGVSMLSQQGLAPLSHRLNTFGWTTILLSAPDTAFTAANMAAPAQEGAAEIPQTEPTNPAPDDADTDAVTNTEADLASDDKLTDKRTIPPPHSKTAESDIDAIIFEQHQQDLISLLKVAEGQVDAYPGFYLVIGQGTSAAWLAKIFAEAKSKTPDALIAISAFWPDRTYNQLLPTLMSATSLPVLDIYSASDNEWVLSTANTRQTTATTALKLHYRQRQLLGSPRSQQKADYLAKEVHGWLSNMGW